MAMVQGFLVKKAPEIDPAWNPAVAQFTASQAVKDRTSRYKEFIRKYVYEAKDPHLQAFRVDATHTWDDVQVQIDRATELYELQGSGWRFPFRRFGRAFSENASAVKVFLDLLPSGDYGSTLCGALNVVFGAAIRMSEIRDKVFKCLARVPEVIEYTKGYLHLYCDDIDLRRIAQDLYIAILEAVQDMMAWFNEKAYKKVCKAIFRQENYAAQLEQKTGEGIDSLSDAFSKRTDFCFQKNVKTQNDLQNDCLHSIKVQVTDQHQDLKRELAQLRQIQQTPTPPQIVQPIYVQVVAPPLVSKDDLLSLCNFDLSTILHDIDNGALSGRNLPLAQQSRSAAALQSPRVQAWLRTRTSALLHIDGSECGAGAAISAMSHACSLLWQALEDVAAAGGPQPIIPLVFLCGLHAGDGDPLGGAAGVVRSLTAQLLLKLRGGVGPDLRFVDGALLCGLRAGALAAFCRLFRGVLCSVRCGAVYCIVDGISWIEDEEGGGELDGLLGFLKELVEEVRGAAGGLAVKVLLTSPSVSARAGERLAEEERVALPRSVPNTWRRAQQVHVADGDCEQDDLTL